MLNSVATNRNLTLFAILSIGLIVLNPYTLVGRPGIWMALVLCLVSVISGTYKANLKNNILTFGLLVFISLWGVSMSYLNGIFQLTHLMTVMSLVVTVGAAQGLYYILNKTHKDLDFLILTIVGALCLNFVIILIEANWNDFRLAVESVLAPAGNLDWKTVDRFRGIASSGGAGLSICTPIYIALVAYLFEKEKLGIISTIILSLIGIMATLVIGRTGLVAIPLVGLFYFFHYFIPHMKDSKKRLKAFIFIISTVVVLLISKGFVEQYLISKFGSHYADYAFGFIFRGIEGIKSNASAMVVLKYITTLPSTFPEVLIGKGFYGGSAHVPWTDSGHARTFFSVGYIWGLLFYGTLLFYYFKNYKQEKFLLGSIGAVLLFAELKEPLLFSGNGARIFILMVVYLELKKYYQRSELA